MAVSQSTNAVDWLDEHGDVLFGYALRRVGDRGLAEDLVQETLLAALQARTAFDARSSERTWLVGILKHRIADHFRRISREAASTDMTADASDALFGRSGKWREPLADWVDPQRAFESREFWDVFQGCVRRLPARMRAALVMRDIDGDNPAETCQSLGISATNLWTLLHRARLRLRACLQQNWFDQSR